MWDWALGATGGTAFTFGESAASTAAAQLVNIATASGSDTVPLTVTNGATTANPVSINMSAGGLAIGGSNVLKLPYADTTSIAVGEGALPVQSATSSNNTAVGYQALNVNTTGVQNTALGSGALLKNTTAANNTAVGYQALKLNVTGTWNTAVGSNALYSNTASYNTAVGYSALNDNTGSNNTAFGFYALYDVTTGSNNTALGYDVGSTTLATGSGNVLIGTSSAVDTPLAATSNFLNIGNTIFATGVNTGTLSAPAGNVGIGTAAPGVTLDVNGAIRPGGVTTGAACTGEQGAISHDSTTYATVYCNSSSVWAAGGSATLNGITAATADGTAQDSGAYTIVWNWNSLTSGTGLTLGSSSLTTGSVLTVSNTNSAATGSAVVGATNSAAGSAVYGDNSAGGYGVFSTGNIGLNTGDGIVFAGTTGAGTPTALQLADGDLALAAGSYINFGATDGSGGYGIWDNSGTIECKNSGGSWVACGSTTLSSITAATQANTIDSLNYAQTWNWSTLTSGSAMTLAATSTGANANATLTATNATTGSGSAIVGSDTSSTNTGAGVYGANASATGFGVYCSSSYECGGNKAWTSSSDRRLKDRITDLPPSRGLDAILKLRPVTFHWKDKKSDVALGQRLGFIAQEVRPIFPETIGISPNKMLNLAYSDLTVPLVKAVQQLYAKWSVDHAALAALVKTVAKQQAEINALVKSAVVHSGPFANIVSTQNTLSVFHETIAAQQSQIESLKAANDNMQAANEHLRAEIKADNDNLQAEIENLKSQVKGLKGDKE